MALEHGAFVTHIKVSPHPDADRLAIGRVGGFQVVVGKDTEDGQLGVFFTSELKVSAEYAAANDLLPVRDETGNRIGGGYFPESLRVKAQKFRGEDSDGYFAPLDSLAFTGADLGLLKEGDLFVELNGIPVCSKFVNPHVKGGGGVGSGGGSQKPTHWFPEHDETSQLGYNITKIEPGGVASLTLKVHGTSGRTGRVPTTSCARSWWRRILGLPPKCETTLEILTGSRRRILKNKAENVGYHGNEDFRVSCTGELDGVRVGEVIYYEIVGYNPSGTPLMPRHDFKKVPDKQIAKWGDGIAYDYGLEPGAFDIYVYRITQMVDVAGQGLVPVQVDLSWSQVKRRCRELGVKHVPELHPPVLTSTITQDREAFFQTVKGLADGPDPIDPGHPREGVVVRIDSADGKTKFFKTKGLTFKIGEGIAEESGNFDIETSA